MTSGWYQQSGGTTGISLTSTGGVGAQGGDAYTDGPEGTFNVYGGAGGTGGAGGAATATLDSLSNEAGGAGIQLTDLHNGIEITSTGGSGGEGGEANCDTTADCSASSGEGGTGGAGGTASLSASGSSVSITEFKSTGIAVASNGGAGGKGGTTKLGGGSSKGVSSGDYGKGGKGGAGGDLTFDLTGSFVTLTDSAAKASHGIALTSFGGVGGDGNNPDGSGDQPGFNDGGAGGEGGEVSLQLTGSGITASVTKDDAIAVWIASKGGDGGNVGTASGDVSNNNSANTGAGGGNGDAGEMLTFDADSNSTLTVSTSGSGGSKGALTMISAGGAGGDGGTDSLYGEESVGGYGGDGGEIKVTFDGTITATTSGDDAFGLMFESSGGDGGVAYNYGDNDGGAGGAIDVGIIEANITTTGSGSHGIYVASLGGSSGDTYGGGNNGDGGAVTLEVDLGTIAISGDNAYGIYAISESGSGSDNSDGTASNVKLTLGADITVSGEDSIGVYLKSSGLSGSGDIEVMIDGTGSVTASGDAETAVNFGVGNDNTLVNDGIIATDDLSSSSIFALTSKEGGVGVTNNRTFSGSVKLADGFSSTFTNSTSGTLNLGSYFYLGTDGTLTNEGIVSPGGKGSVLSSSVTGAFTQSSDGTYLVDIDGSSTDALTFETAGTTIRRHGPGERHHVALVERQRHHRPGEFRQHRHVQPVRKRHGHNRLHARHEQFERDQSGLGRQSRRPLGGANANQSSVANHLQQILENGGLGPELSQLLNIVSVEDYLAALDTLASQVSSDGQLTALMSNMQFSDALLSCADYAGAYRFVSQDQCAWLKFGVIRSERDGSSENHPFDQTAAQFAGGAQFQIARGLACWRRLQRREPDADGGRHRREPRDLLPGRRRHQAQLRQHHRVGFAVGGLRPLRHHAYPRLHGRRQRHRAAVDRLGSGERLACLCAGGRRERLVSEAAGRSRRRPCGDGGLHGARRRRRQPQLRRERRDVCQRAAGGGDRRRAERRQRPADPPEPECRPHALPDRCGAVGAGVVRRHPGGRGAVHHRQRLRQDLCRREGRGGHPHCRQLPRLAAGLRAVLAEHHQLRRLREARGAVLKRRAIMSFLAKAAPALAALAGLTLTCVSAQAGCTTSGTTATCTGDLSSIAQFSYDNAGVDTLIFEDIDESYDRDGKSNVMLLTDAGDDGTDDGDSGSAADDLTITYDTGDYGFDATSGTTTGIEISSEGGAGTAAGTVDDTSTPADDGGGGGAGGDATLDAKSGWYQQSGGTTGISVTSTGGAGAQGGESEYTGDSEAHIYGGSGGAGGDSGTVTTTLDSLSDLAGGAGLQLTDLHNGIELTAAGGDGGQGGESRCDTNAFTSKDCYATSGEGGAGGAGGAASLSATGSSISITEFKTTAIAVSITGGDGGKGGLTKLDQWPAWAENDGDYGRGGDGGAGGALTFDLTGSFVTATDSAGKASHAIALTTFGGDGGDGNDNSASDAGANVGELQLFSGFGDGGDGGSGGTVSLQLTGSGITASVSKDDAIAVWIASKGGAGGTIGTANDITSTLWGYPKLDNTANGGVGGAGGMLSLDANSGSTLTISTSGAGGSKGALTMLSAGGAGADSAGGTYVPFYGADSVGGAGGDGGEIKVTFDGTVTATTGGDDAYGLMFESTGGDGGTGYAGDGDGGAGGAVGVTLADVAITTTGAKSYGVYASSLGGNGGDSTSGGGGGGSNGDGGAVTLEVDAGTIGVSGDSTLGIYAISESGSGGSGADGVSGDVKVTLGAALTVSGEDGIGILLKSSGLSGNGDLSVTIASGGSVTASGDAESAVTFSLGDDNTLVNDGTIATDDLTSSSIFALTSKEGGVGVTNNGTFSGSVDLADGYGSTFTNSSSGTLEPGASFDLGSDGTLTNDGTISPGGEGVVLTSTITGTVTQSSTGTYLVDIDGGETDEMVFETAGTSLAGAVSVNIVSATETSGSSTIAMSDSGDIDSSLAAIDTTGASYTLTQGSSDTVTLNWSFNFNNDTALGTANDSQSAVANHLQQILESGGALGVELSQLLNITSVEDYLAALDTFASQVSSDGQLTALMSNLQFSDALLSCAEYGGAYRFVVAGPVRLAEARRDPLGARRQQREPPLRPDRRAVRRRRPVPDRRGLACWWRLQRREPDADGGRHRREPRHLLPGRRCHQAQLRQHHRVGLALGGLRPLRHHAYPRLHGRRQRHRAAVDRLGSGERLACLCAGGRRERLVSEAAGRSRRRPCGDGRLHRAWCRRRQPHLRRERRDLCQRTAGRGDRRGA